MNHVFDILILDISKIVIPNKFLHKSTVQYLQSIIYPYFEIMINSNNVEEIKTWISLTFNESLNRLLLNVINETLETVTFESDEALKRHISNTIVTKLLSELILEASVTFFGTIVLPWDIINSNQELNWNLPVFPNDNRLLITVNINNKEYYHMLTYEFAMGLLAFSLYFENAYTLHSYGSILDNSIVDNRLTDRNLQTVSNYRIKLIDQEDYFYTKSGDFIQGFNTGALWLDLDPKEFIITLEQYDLRTGFPKNITF
jgi:hypothetical protein